MAVIDLVHRLADAATGAHLGYGAVGPDGSHAAAIASRLGAPAVWETLRPDRGRDYTVSLLWYPTDRYLDPRRGVVPWPHVLGGYDAMILAILQRRVEPQTYPDPAEYADAIRAGLPGLLQVGWG